MGEKVDVVYLIATMPGRHSGDQVHKVKKTAAPLFLLFTASGASLFVDFLVIYRAWERCTVPGVQDACCTTRGWVADDDDGDGHHRVPDVDPLEINAEPERSSASASIPVEIEMDNYDEPEVPAAAPVRKMQKAWSKKSDV